MISQLARPVLAPFWSLVRPWTVSSYKEKKKYINDDLSKSTQHPFYFCTSFNFIIIMHHYRVIKINPNKENLKEHTPWKLYMYTKEWREE